jgi:hypothetical protein
METFIIFKRYQLKKEKENKRIKKNNNKRDLNEMLK